MTDNNHPITPPPELRLQWKQEWLDVRPSLTNYAEWMLAKTARWGYEQRAAVNEAELQKARDEELDACCAWLSFYAVDVAARDLRAARRPEPPSLKEQALGLLNEGPVSDLHDSEVAIIRRALESLPE